MCCIEVGVDSPPWHKPCIYNVLYTVYVCVDHPVPDEDEEPERQDHNDWAWLPLFAALTTLAYLWTPKQDPIPEVSFPFFLQHMLYTGEV